MPCNKQTILIWFDPFGSIKKSRPGIFRAKLKGYNLKERGITRKICIAEMLLSWESIYKYNFNKIPMPEFGPINDEGNIEFNLEEIYENN